MTNLCVPPWRRGWRTLAFRSRNSRTQSRRSVPEVADCPDVVITDIDLGTTLNGFDVAAAAHDRWPSVHVVLISGLPADHTGLRLDPRDRYLQKPLSGTSLLRTIEELAKAA